MTVHLARMRWSLALGWCAGLGLYLVAMQWVTEAQAMLLADAAWTLTSALACWWCFRAVRWVEPAARCTWQLLGCGCLCWLIGQLHWDHARLVQGIELPFPSLTHGFYSAFALFMLLGLRQLPQLRQPDRSGGRPVGNIALVTLCLAVILILGMVGPALRADLAPLYLWGGLVHTLVVTGAFLVALHALWSVQWQGRWPAMLMLVLANGLYALSNIIYTHALLDGSYLSTDLVNIGWLAMFGLVACAAREQIWMARRLRLGVAPPVAGWVWLQSVVPAVLVILMAIVAVSSAATLTPRVVSWALAMFIVLALMLSMREAWLHRDRCALTERLRRASERLPADLPVPSRMGLEAALQRFRQHADAQHLHCHADAAMNVRRETSSCSEAATQLLALELLNYLEVRALRYHRRAERGELDMNALLDDLLRHYASLEGAGSRTRVDLAALIAQTLQTLEQDLHRCRIQVCCQRSPLIWHSPAGELPMVLVLRTLLGKTLQLTRGVAVPQVCIHCSLDSGHVQLSISGNGDALDWWPPASHGLQDAAAAGDGLSLALVLRAVQRMAGSVNATSPAGEGSRFVVELPDFGPADAWPVDQPTLSR